jgi:hypothetical protein
MEHYLCDELWNRGDKKIPQIKKAEKTENEVKPTEEKAEEG